MSFNDLMSKIRHWDNRSAQWMMKHFYMLFFEFILVGVFVFFFVNTLKLVDISEHVSKTNLLENLIFAQTVNVSLIVVLLLFNSFWLLYIFNSLLRLRGILRNIDYNLGRRRNDNRDNDTY